MNTNKNIVETKKWLKQLSKSESTFDINENISESDVMLDSGLTHKEFYLSVRKEVFTYTPKELRLTLPSDKIIIYNILMDLKFDDFMASMESNINGSVNLFLSSGSSIVGGGQHKIFVEMVKKYFGFAQGLLGNTIKTKSTELPTAFDIKFFFMTNKGLYVAEEQMINIKNKSSVWLPLFEAGCDVLVELKYLTIKAAKETIEINELICRT